jgi:single-strand DNA-binding protein
MSTNYEFDPESGAKADDVASRIDTSAAYIGQFKLAHAMKSSKGTEGIHFEFTSPGGGSASFDIWTKKEDGTTVWGMNQLNAMMSILGLRGLRAVEGEFEAYDADSGKRVPTKGEVFPELCNKDIGLVLQKELYTKNDGKEGYRMNLFGIFHPVSRLTASELKDRKSAPEKIEKMLRGLKTKDSRRAVAAEPAQPAVGAGEGGY